MYARVSLCTKICKTTDHLTIIKADIIFQIILSSFTGDIREKGINSVFETFSW